ncbi:MAG: hypothetical protein K8L99_18205 [Anaerolineae bacterium]|nr:hypothetical protein [Anaerolineae bacterium]
MAIERTSLTLTVDGSGNASGITTEIVDGEVLAVYLDPDGSMDVTITESGESPALPVLAVTGISAAAWYYPRLVLHDSSDGSALDGPVDVQQVASYLAVAVANGTENDELAVTIVWRDAEA